MKTALLFLLVLVACVARSADRVAPEPFALTVVPSRSSQHGRSVDMGGDKPEQFYVVLTNSSKDAQAVFDHSNSWGYQNVSLEFTMPDGKKLMASKRIQEFTVNFPSTFLVPSGEHRVFAIRLGKEWQVRPELAVAAETRIQLRAVYEVPVTPEATEHRVWQGRVQSKPYAVTLRHLKP